MALLFKEKSQFQKDLKQDKRDARKAARDKKKDARKDAREEKKDARKDHKAEKKDARKDKRDAMRDIRKGDLKGKDKREAKKGVRQDKKDRISESKDTKKDRRQDAKAEKRDAVKDANEQKKTALKALRIPRAFDRKWNSYLRFQSVKAMEIFQPKTLAHLQSILRIAAENELHVRAIGSGHSFSEIGVTNDIFVQTHEMNKFLPLGRAKRRKRFKPEYHDETDAKLAECEIGITILDLSKELEKQGHALFNQGTYDGQTLWGAVSTSTHGSGIGRFPFPDMIRSLVLVSEGGRTYRIEPGEGITNPSNWSEKGVDELIQDNDTFYSVICSMGCMGIVYSAVIEVRDMYWLDEWNFITTWDTVKSAFQRPDDLRALLDSWDTFEMLVSPTRAPKGKKDGVTFADEHPCSLTFRRETSERRKIGGRVMDSLAKALESGIGPIKLITGNSPADSKFAISTKIFRDDSRLATLAVRNVGKKGWTGGDLDPDEFPIQRRNKCYKIFPKGGKLFGGYGVEFAFDYTRTFDVMDEIMRVAEANKRVNRHHTAPVAVRYVKKSRAYASPQYGRDTVMFEVLMAKGTKQGKEALEEMEREILKLPGVRLHWGLSMGVMDNSGGRLNSMYPKWRRWRNTYGRFNAGGTFNNAFTDRIGIST